MMNIGLIYDVFGRKVPLLIFVAILIVTELTFPFLTNVRQYYITAMFTSLLTIIITNPFIPDLIKEESHGMGNMLRTNCINLGYIVAYSLLYLNATGSPMFDSSVIFFILSFLLVCLLVLLKIGMKDIIKEGKHLEN